MSEWTHIVLNYIGPNDGQGIQIYQDGVLARTQTVKMALMTPYQPGDGRAVLGRKETNQDRDYSSIEMDELLFFNNKLTAEEVRMIYDKY